MTEQERRERWERRRPLSNAERLALLDRSEYEPVEAIPAKLSERFTVRCRLCGAVVRLKLINLRTNDEGRRLYDPDARRETCYHAQSHHVQMVKEEMKESVMQSLPALPNDIDPNDSHVELRMMQCRTRGEQGPAVSLTDKNNPGHLWDPGHAEATGHHYFYAWTLTRNTAQSGTVGSLRRGEWRKGVSDD